MERKMCLDIPVPPSVRDLRPHPQTLPAAHLDSAVRHSIQEFGKEHNIPLKEVEKAYELADGYHDVVVLLERPANNHNYDVSFKDFVEMSPVLKSLDETLRFITSGARDIRTTSILDVFMFKPKGRWHPPSDNKCHDLVQELLCLIKPDCVIACCSKFSAEHRLSRFHSVQPQDAPIPATEEIEGKSVACIRCFHPGYFVNHIQHEPKARLAFIVGIMLGFTPEENCRDAINNTFRSMGPIRPP
jgi:hypothetical protein